MSCLPGMPCFGGHSVTYQRSCGIDPCLEHKTSTDSVFYTGPNLPCIDVNTCTNMTLILEKIDNALCGENLIQNIIDTLINNPTLFEQFCTLIIKRCVDCDYILDCVIDGGCCGSTTTTTTTQACVCKTYALFNTQHSYPIVVEFIDCDGNYTETVAPANGDPVIICACEGSIRDVNIVEVLEIGSPCNIPPCLEPCDVIYNSGSINQQGDDTDPKLYYYNVTTNTSTELFVEDIYGSRDVASTNTRLWMYKTVGGDTLITEYKVWRCPFIATFNRDITLTGVTLSNGLCAKSDTVLIGVNQANQVIEIDVSGVSPVVTNKFSLISVLMDERIVSGDMMLTTTGKLILTTEKPFSAEYFISQIDYTAFFPQLEIDLEITRTLSNPWGLFEYNGEIYIGTKDGDVFTINQNYPYTITLVDNTGNYIYGASNSPQCITEQLLTTTTTTTIPICYCYEVDSTPSGEYLIEWNNCEGVPQSTALNASIINICAQEGTVTYSGVGGIVVTGGTSICTQDSDCYQPFIMRASDLQTITLTTFKSTTPFIVDWGDGIVQSFAAGNYTGGSAINHTYSAITYPLGYTGDITISASNLGQVEKLSIYGGALTPSSYTSLTVETSELMKLTGLLTLELMQPYLDGVASELPDTITRLISAYNNLSGTTADLPTDLTYINISGNNVISGAVSDLPSGLTFINITGDNTISGNIQDMPAGSTYFRVDGDNTIGGTIAGGLSSSLTTLSVEGNNTIAGDIANFNSNMVVIKVLGDNTLTGDVRDLTSTSITYFSVDGQNDISGDIIGFAGMPIVTLSIIGNNTVSGDVNDLPSSLTYLELHGSNFVTGDIVDLPVNLYYISILGENTLSGNLSSITGRTSITTFNIQGTGAGGNTIAGSLSNIPSSIKQFILTGDTTVADYTAPHIWNSTMTSVIVKPDTLTPSFTSTEIDNILINLATYATTWTFGPMMTGKEITLVGTRTAASNAAVTTLNSRGVTITLF